MCIYTYINILMYLYLEPGIKIMYLYTNYIIVNTYKMLKLVTVKYNYHDLGVPLSPLHCEKVSYFFSLTLCFSSFCL